MQAMKMSEKGLKVDMNIDQKLTIIRSNLNFFLNKQNRKYPSSDPKIKALLNQSQLLD